MGGISITLSGYGFPSDTKAVVVSVGGRPCPVSNASLKSVICTVPAGFNESDFASNPVGRPNPKPTAKLDYLMPVSTRDCVFQRDATVPITLSVPAASRSVSAGNFKYDAAATAVVRQLSPSFGSAAGGVYITLSGINFAANSTVMKPYSEHSRLPQHGQL